MERRGRVSTIYELDVETPSGSASMLLSQWDRVRDGRLAATTMIFDTGERAVELLREALTAGEA